MRSASARLMPGTCARSFTPARFTCGNARKPETMTEKRFAFVEGGACFWHMVDLLWIVLFPLIYLMH